MLVDDDDRVNFPEQSLSAVRSTGLQVEPSLQSDRVVAGFVAGGEEQRDGLTCLPIE
jgi:hypothetical protein